MCVAYSAGERGDTPCQGKHHALELCRTYGARQRRKANIPYNLRNSHRFEEVRGKTLDFVELYTSGGFHCVDVRFQDKTSLTLEIEPTFVAEPYHSDWKTGNWRPLKRWPLIHSKRL